MKTLKFLVTLHHRVASLLALLGALISATAPPAALAQRYVPTDIVVPAGDSFRADAMNDLGQVSGGYTPAGGLEQPVVWENGAFTQLPLLPGTVLGWARGLNNLGQIVGACSTVRGSGTTRPRACIWENGTVRELPDVSGAAYSAAWAINDVGTIVGHVYTASGSSYLREAVVWRDNAIAKLVPPVAGAQTWARAINDSGQLAVVWWEGNGSGQGYCARWTPDVPNGTSGTMIPLGAYGLANDLNDTGVIAGMRSTQAMIWDGLVGFELPIGGLYYDIFGTANSINDAGMVVGDWTDDFGDLLNPFLWDAQGGVSDLNTMLAASTPVAYPGSLQSGVAINNAGQILVQSWSAQYALLTPSAQPPVLEPPAVDIWVNQGVVQLDWAGLDSDWSYRLKRATVSGGPYTTIATITESIDGYPNYYSFQDTSAVPGVRYYYVVSAVDGPNESANSAEVTAMLLAPPVAPSALTASVPKGPKRTVLGWNQSTSQGIVLNRVYRSMNAGAYAQIAVINAGTSYTDNAVSRGTTYNYFVTAVNANGQESPASNVVSVQLK